MYIWTAGCVRTANSMPQPGRRCEGFLFITSFFFIQFKTGCHLDRLRLLLLLGEVLWTCVRVCMGFSTLLFPAERRDTLLKDPPPSGLDRGLAWITGLDARL